MDIIKLINHRESMPIVFDKYVVSVGGDSGDFVVIRDKSGNLLASIQYVTNKITIFDQCIIANKVDELCDDFNIQPYTYYICVVSGTKIPSNLKFYSYRRSEDTFFYEPKLFIAGKERFYVPGLIPNAKCDYFDKCIMISCANLAQIAIYNCEYSESEILCLRLIIDGIIYLHLVLDICKSMADSHKISRIIAFHRNIYYVIDDIKTCIYSKIEAIKGDYFEYVTDYFSGLNFHCVKSATSA